MSKPMMVFARLCQVLTATTVILVLLHCLQGAVGMVFDAALQAAQRRSSGTVNPAQRAANERAPRPESPSMRFRPDGTVDCISNAKARELDPVTIRSGGSLVWEGEARNMPFEHLNFAPHRFNWSTGAERKQQWAPPRWSPTPPETVDFPVILEESQTAEVWRYNRRENIFQGFRLRGKPIGYLGRNGFSTTKREVEPFDTCLSFHPFLRDKTKNGLILWATRRGVYRLDLARKEVKNLIEPETAYSAAQLMAWDKPQEAGPEGKEKQVLAIEFGPKTYRIVVAAPFAEHQVQFPDSDESGATLGVQFALHRGILFAQRHVRVDASGPAEVGAAGRAGRDVFELYRMEDDHTPLFVNRYVQPLDAEVLDLAAPTPSRGGGQDAGPVDRDVVRQDLLASVHPLAYGIVVRAIDKWAPADLRKQMYRLRIPPAERGLHHVYPSNRQKWLSAVVRNSLPLWPPAMTTSLLVAATLLLSRRRHVRWPQALGWCALTLLFNLSGFLACLLLIAGPRPANFSTLALK